jgi:hypothetical protein
MAYYIDRSWWACWELDLVLRRPQDAVNQNGEERGKNEIGPTHHTSAGTRRLITASLKHSISSNCGLNWRSRRFTPADSNLPTSAHQRGSKPAVWNRIFLDRHVVFELRTIEPVLLIRVASGMLLHVRDAIDLLLHLGLGLSHTSVTGDAE